MLKMNLQILDDRKKLYVVVQNYFYKFINNNGDGRTTI